MFIFRRPRSSDSVGQRWHRFDVASWLMDWATIPRVWLLALILIVVSGGVYAGYHYLQRNQTADSDTQSGDEGTTEELLGLPTPADQASESPAPAGSSTTSPSKKSRVKQPTPSPSASDQSESSSVSPSSSSTAAAPTPSSSLPACGSNTSYLTQSPINLSDFNGLVPLGGLNPNGGHVFPTDHIYFYFTTGRLYPIYAPGDVTVTSISASQNITQGYTDYSVYFSPCSELTVYYLHVTSLTNKLSDAFVAPFQWDSSYTTGGNQYRNYGKNTSVTLTAGEQLGETGGNPSQISFDMGAHDTRVTIAQANPARWTQSNSRHTVCPIDYYAEPLKTTLMNRFGEYDGSKQRTVAPVCGTIAQDVADTAQGVWFVKGTTNPWQGEDPHLALTHGNIDPSQAVFSVGTSMSASDLHVGYYTFSPQSSGLINRDFADVRSDGNIYCFEMSGQGWVPGTISLLVQLPTPTTLKIERQSASACGGGPWSFSGSTSEFER